MSVPKRFTVVVDKSGLACVLDGNVSGAPYVHDVTTEEALLIAKEANAVHLRGGDSLTVHNEYGNVTWTAPRSAWLDFAAGCGAVAMFYGRMGIFTNPRVHFPTLLTACGINIEEFITTFSSTEEEVAFSEGWERGIGAFLAAMASDEVGMVYSRPTSADATVFAKARDVIKWAHSLDQRRNGLEFYAEHPIRMANALLAMQGYVVTDTMVIAALLHDVLEKTHYTEQMLDDAGLNSIHATAMVRLLTHDDSMYTNEQYADGIINSGDIDLMLVKLADWNDNIVINPAFLWEGWENSLRRYSENAIAVTKAIHQVTSLI